MEIDHYDDIKRSSDLKVYTFTSRGPKGDLLKIVNFGRFHKIPDAYNLALGTIKTRNEIDYFETSDNNDRDKILSTIFYISLDFIKAYPNRKIFITGRNTATTRLYRAAINHEYDNLVENLIIHGLTYNESAEDYTLEPFLRNKKYDAFLFERRRPW